MAQAFSEHVVQVPAGPVTLEGDLAIPAGARAVVLFAHGSGSSRLSPRNRHVARVLRDASLGTLLIDLLTREEEEADARTAHLRFDVPLLARRLGAIADWLAGNPATVTRRIGLFGASTGAAAALIAAAERPDAVSAVVSRGGRPDLAGADVLRRVRVPTLLVVGERDTPVVQLNEEALALLPGEKHLAIVPGATHLFEEPGALDRVAHLAAGWFAQHLLG
jgi:putative phosphoribosyl transferase